ncbi:MAG TPA: hypothetical protein VHN18_11140, partial [Micromonosporaceae bacterium]|nr:hypothetical protein [Micromonosporaceae bacterium]
CASALVRPVDCRGRGEHRSRPYDANPAGDELLGVGATTGDPAIALRMVAAGQVDVIVVAALADLPQVDVAERSRPVPPPAEVDTPVRRRRPQPVPLCGRFRPRVALSPPAHPVRPADG